MEHFQLRPDYKKISKYCSLPTSLEQLEDHFADGYPIVLNSYFNGVEYTFTGNHLTHVKKALRVLINWYNLAGEHENILFILLSTYQSIDNANDYLFFNYTRKIQTKQLAKLLLAFKTTPQNQIISMTLKTNLNSSTSKITDQELISWIYSAIQNKLDREQTHPGFMTPHDMQLQSQEDLIWHTNQKVPKPIKVPAIEYVMPLHHYLINETALRPEAGTQLSDRMANFYFSLLVILEVINPDKIQSEGKDYIHASFANHQKRQLADS